MNVVEFTKTTPEPHSGLPSPLVEIRVDGRLLEEIMKDVELPMAEREGSPDIAGGYRGLALPRSPESYYLGREPSEYGARRTTLLGCSCGIAGCWPLLCEILETDDEVLWRDFAQPYRGPRSKASFWDYAGFGGFRFDRQQYLEALDRLREAG